MYEKLEAKLVIYVSEILKRYFAFFRSGCFSNYTQYKNARDEKLNLENLCLNIFHVYLMYTSVCLVIAIRQCKTTFELNVIADQSIKLLLHMCKTC